MHCKYLKFSVLSGIGVLSASLAPMSLTHPDFPKIDSIGRLTHQNGEWMWAGHPRSLSVSNPG